jgi:hypothetical protein
VAGYSQTALAAKLGIKNDSTLVLLDAPGDLELFLPEGVTLLRHGHDHADVVVAFFIDVDKLEARIDELGSMIFPAGSLWLSWPKKASRVETNLSDTVVREVALRRGLVDNKVCAVDPIWSALRVVWRKELRQSRLVGHAHDEPGPSS